LGFLSGRSERLIIPGASRRDPVCHGNPKAFRAELLFLLSSESCDPGRRDRLPSNTLRAKPRLGATAHIAPWVYAILRFRGSMYANSCAAALANRLRQPVPFQVQESSVLKRPDAGTTKKYGYAPRSPI
jgi:hypothetical protein